jgi:hypothetical protein
VIRRDGVQRAGMVSEEDRNEDVVKNIVYKESQTSNSE